MTAATALLEHGEAVATEVLAQNARRWDDLSAADRTRVDALARSLAHRLLHEPALRLAAAERAGDQTRVRLTRDLFGL
jgi:glutamyl-tRNA reductase